MLLQILIPFNSPLYNINNNTLHLKLLKPLVEAPEVPPHNLIAFIKLFWKNNKDLITTPVLESLVSSICSTVPTDYEDIELRKDNILLLWDLLKRIGHYQIGLLNTQILNQLLGCFSYMEGDKGKAALEVFHKFEVFQCVPNQDTYIFTLHALFSTSCSTDVVLQQAASICQKMVLHPETLLPDNDFTLGRLLTWFSEANMIEETRSLSLAANEKRKRNSNWSLCPTMMFELCSKKETIHLAFQMLTDIDIPEGTKLRLCEMVLEHLCWFNDFDTAKQLIFKMIADGPLPCPSKHVFNVIISAYVEVGEIGQALEMVMLSESIGIYTCDALLSCYSHSGGTKVAEKIFEKAKKKDSKKVAEKILEKAKKKDSKKVAEKILEKAKKKDSKKMAEKILEKAKKKDSKLITALLYHTLIVIHCDQQNFDEALKLLTQMKDFSFSIHLDEYHKLILSLCFKAMDRKMAREQLRELEPMDRKMAKEQLFEMALMDRRMAKEKLEEINLNVRASFSQEVRVLMQK